MNLEQSIRIAAMEIALNVQNASGAVFKVMGMPIFTDSTHQELEASFEYRINLPELRDGMDEFPYPDPIYRAAPDGTDTLDMFCEAATSEMQNAVAYAAANEAEKIVGMSVADGAVADIGDEYGTIAMVLVLERINTLNYIMLNWRD